MGVMDGRIWPTVSKPTTIWYILLAKNVLNLTIQSHCLVKLTHIYTSDSR